MYRAVVILLAAPMLAAAQQSTAPDGAPTRSFEVASVKPNLSGSLAQSGQSGKGSMTMTNMRVRALIVTAYSIRPDRVIGAPAWIDQDRFDISARAPADTPDNELPMMLRALLAERFGLVARSEVREQPVYALVVARADGALGPNLKSSSECDAEPNRASVDAAGVSGRQVPGQIPCGVLTGSNAGEAYIRGGARSMALLARTLQGVSGRPVVDRTGLVGTYDFELRFAPALLGAEPSGPDVPSIFAALQEQLGLRLEPAQGPVEFLLVDRIGRPTPD